MYKKHLYAKYDVALISNKEDLSVEFLKLMDPDVVFFLDWSWIIKKDILDGFTCIGFHTAPLPMYRGGSPIQNQIIRGEKESVLSAFLMDDGIDTGDIVLQRPVSLEGHILDVMCEISTKTHLIIDEIIKSGYTSKPQQGEGSYYKRRKPSESELRLEDFDKDIEYLYNFMRMLEDPYPNAFIRIGNKQISFKSAEKHCDTIQAQIEIKEIV